MSTITKEWLQQKIADMEAIRDDIPFGLGEDGTNTLAALRIALASLEAEFVGEVSEQRDGLVMDGTVDLGGASTHRIIKGASKMKRLPLGTKFYTSPPAPANAEPVAWLWSHRKHPSEVTLVRHEDDEMAEGSRWSGWSCQALYAAPPAPVSVPEWTNEQCLEFLSIAFRHAEIKGDLELDDIRLGVKMVNGSRAAMLQGADGNSPVIPDGWVACSERMPSAGEQVLAYRPDAPESNDPLIKMATYVGGSAHGHGFDCYCKPTHWMPLPAAPQQEA
ncbi:DUF551 domain-containing protein [Enterobacter roggenkampii]